MKEHIITKTLADICDLVRFRGVYADYDDCCKRLQKMLKITDAIEINRIMMNLNHQVFFKNMFSEYLWSSPRFAHMLGVADADEMAGQNDYEMGWSHEMATQIQEADEYVLIHANTSTRSEHWVLPDGVDRVFEVHRYPVFDENNYVIGILGVAREQVLAHSVRPAAVYARGGLMI